MSIKDKYRVLPIEQSDYKEWLLYKHYAHRMPMAIEYAFGLYNEENIICGVCVFGPTAPLVPITIFGEIGKHKVRELTRLVINDNVEKNTLSYFVSNCLRLLPSMCIVSFADANKNHHGYIYQATNWIYTGIGGGTDIYKDKDGNDIHLLTINDRIKVERLKNTNEYCKKYNITKEKAKPKYRYLYFLGNKFQIKQMKMDLKLKVLPYPKGDNERYDTSFEPDVQPILF